MMFAHAARTAGSTEPSAQTGQERDDSDNVHRFGALHQTLSREHCSPRLVDQPGQQKTCVHWWVRTS
jgi:hypothetical protein